ncbi:c-type cytochrome [Marinovum sp.]|uniref:c-type cytochrome n=1 Tax=Marinovum sp. TaxID=2024839 RepID=UPI002B266A39|nr:c-type cytochrome [Marinovum sp.]
MKLRDFDIRTAAVSVAVLAALAGVGAVSVVGLGLYNVSARDGHWPGVSWVLHSTFRNAASLRAPPQSQVPKDLDTPDRVALGAGHFTSGCAPCHGAPGQPRSATVRQMVPAPPPLTHVAEKFEATELFWIVRNGIKMTGMPAWPGDRPDEVWSMVAFLRALPEMTPEAYAALAGEGSCASCHGPRGVSRNQHVPRLDILSEAYIARSLTAYLEGTRDSGVMAEAVSGLEASAVPGLAAEFAQGRPDGTAEPGQGAEAGRALAAGGSRGVPACRACHGPWPEPLNPAFPSLAGQQAAYLAQQLRLWREGNRGGGPAAELMYKSARELTDAEIEALAAYYAGLAPAELNAVSD